jgi:tellurite resistance protein TehA-like permease
MNNPSVKFTGGFRVGWFTGTFPFATLVVASDKISLSVRPFFFTALEIYEFSPEQVVSIEPYGFMQGLRIRHVVPSYPRNIIFGPFSPHKVYSEIVRVGFRPTASPALLLANRGMPFRLTFIVLFLILWNFPYFLSRVISMSDKTGGLIVTLEFLVVCLVSALALRSSFIQSVMLRPGRNIKEVSLFLKFLSPLAGFLFLMGMLLTFFSG